MNKNDIACCGGGGGITYAKTKFGAREGQTRCDARASVLRAAWRIR